ncbi:MAG: NrfD/PsrC family molybdoenzyme membrane anchor subunit, partial [Verrucomicrobiia bacterium]
VFHVGRVWFAWYLFPIPNSNYLWQNFRSPLEWDVFAVSTYGTVSVLFWYVGLIPDLAILRDRFYKAGNKTRSFLYGFFAMGWRGANRHWSNYEMAYLILAGVSTPLVLSVHT